MRFESPENFLILIGVLFLAVFVFMALARKKKLLQKFGDIPLILKNAPYISFARQGSKSAILLLALVFVTMALARLQFGTHMELLKREGIDLIVALDVSNSMLAQDLKPNRLVKAKQEINAIIDRLKGDRIGIVAFAGEAFTQCPLTLDYSAARFLLNSIDNMSVSQQGTSLSAAMVRATDGFEKLEKKHKVLLLMTDGEDQEGGVIEAAEEARKEGIKIYTVGIGNPQGEPIPVLDRKGIQVGFKKDETGQIVVTKLDEETLQKVALATGGKYYRATAGEMELEKIFDEITKMEKKELEGTLVTRFDDRFQWPLLAAIFLMIVEFIMPERKKPAKGTVDA